MAASIVAISVACGDDEKVQGTPQLVFEPDHVEMVENFPDTGYPIERIEREGWWSPGSFSNDVGNRALFTTRVCDP